MINPTGNWPSWGQVFAAVATVAVAAVFVVAVVASAGAVGAAAGSAIPGVGTAIGFGAGLLIGAVVEYTPVVGWVKDGVGCVVDAVGSAANAVGNFLGDLFG